MGIRGGAASFFSKVAPPLSPPFLCLLSTHHGSNNRSSGFQAYSCGAAFPTIDLPRRYAKWLPVGIAFGLWRWLQLWLAIRWLFALHRVAPFATRKASRR